MDTPQTEAMPDQKMSPVEIAPSPAGLMLAPDDSLGTFTAEQGDAIVATATEKIRCAKNLIVKALHITRSHDWQDFGGKPYLEGEGALRMLAVGVKVSAPVFETEHVGEDYFCKVSITAEWFLGQVVHEIGSCNTRDKFFSGDADGSQINKIRRQCAGNEALARRALMDYVEKKALMNAYSRAITAVMGIRGFTWEDLAEAGLVRGQGGTIEFKKPGSGAATAPRPTGGSKGQQRSRKDAAPPTDGSLADLKDAPIGAHIRFECAINGGRQTPKKTFIDVQDGDAKEELQCWGTERPAWAEPGEAVTLSVEVGEWTNKDDKTFRQYTIRTHPE